MMSIVTLLKVILYDPADFRVSRGIHTRGRFVKDQDFVLLQHCSGEHDKLFLPS